MYCMAEVDPQVLKGLLTLLLLSLLAQGDDYGYAIGERLRASGLDDIAEGTIYPALARLERTGLVDTYHVASDRGPARKYYRLSADGRRELDARLEEWRRLQTVVTRLTKGAKS